MRLRGTDTGSVPLPTIEYPNSPVDLLYHGLSGHTRTVRVRRDLPCTGSTTRQGSSSRQDLFPLCVTYVIRGQREPEDSSPSGCVGLPVHERVSSLTLLDQGPSGGRGRFRGCPGTSQGYHPPSFRRRGFRVLTGLTNKGVPDVRVHWVRLPGCKPLHGPFPFPVPIGHRRRPWKV